MDTWEMGSPARSSPGPMRSPGWSASSCRMDESLEKRFSEEGIE